MSTVKSKKLQVGTDASASNNFTIYQPSTPDGTLRIGVGNADNPTEVGRFTSAGYKPQQPVIFSAGPDGASGNQSVSHGTWTKVRLDLEQYDTNSNFDSTTNYRFTPTVAGYYQINFAIYYSAVSQLWIASLWKNGSTWRRGTTEQSGSTGTRNAHGSTTVYLNGSTDYVELYAYQSTGSSQILNANETLVFMDGYLIAQA